MSKDITHIRIQASEGDVSITVGVGNQFSVAIMSPEQAESIGKQLIEYAQKCKDSDYTDSGISVYVRP